MRSGGPERPGSAGVGWHDRAVPVLRSTALIDAPPRTVAGLLRDAELIAAALGRDGHRFDAPGRLLAPGDVVDLHVRMVPGIRVPLRMAVGGGLGAGADRDPGRRTAARAPAHGHAGPDRRRHPRARRAALDQPVRPARARGGRGAAAPAGAAGPGGPARRCWPNGRPRWPTAPVVVATALRRDGRLLIAQRTRPPALAGRWELPGGRVEPGETEPAAVRRECREELGVSVLVGDRVGTDLPIEAGLLRVYLAELAPDAPRAAGAGALGAALGRPGRAGRHRLGGRRPGRRRRSGRPAGHGTGGASRVIAVSARSGTPTSRLPNRAVAASSPRPRGE